MVSTITRLGYMTAAAMAASPAAAAEEPSFYEQVHFLSAMVWMALIAGGLLVVTVVFSLLRGVLKASAKARQSGSAGDPYGIRGSMDRGD